MLPSMLFPSMGHMVCTTPRLWAVPDPPPRASLPRAPYLPAAISSSVASPKAFPILLNQTALPM